VDKLLRLHCIILKTLLVSHIEIEAVVSNLPEIPNCLVMALSGIARAEMKIVGPSRSHTV